MPSGVRPMCPFGCDPSIPGERGITEAMVVDWLVGGGCPVAVAPRRAHVLWHLYCAGPRRLLNALAQELGVSDTRVQLLRDSALRYLRSGLLTGHLPGGSIHGTRLHRALIDPPLGARKRLRDAR